MADKKKTLKDLQNLVKSLGDLASTDVNPDLVDELNKGTLSQQEADQLHGQVTAALKEKKASPPPAVSPEFREEYPSSGGQFGTQEKGYQVKGPIPKERALVPAGERAVLPATLTPEVVSGRSGKPAVANPPKPNWMDVKFDPEMNARTALPAAEAGVESGFQTAVGRSLNALPAATEKAVLNIPALKPLALISAVAAGTYYALSDNEQEKKATTPDTPPSTPPAPSPAPVTPPAPAPVPEAKIKKAAVIPFANYDKSMKEINKDFEKDRQLAPEVKDEFTRRQGELQRALTEARSVYDRSVSEATTAQERREAAIQWASIAESLGQSMVKFFAAQRGARTGQLLGTKVQFEKYDWQKDLDRSLSKLKQQTDQAKVSLGISREDVEEGTKTLKEEQKTALQEREAVAKQRASSRMDLLKEEIRQKAKSEEDYVEAVNRLRIEEERGQRAEAATTQREQAAEAKETTKQEALLRNNFAKLQGGLRAIAAKDSAAGQKSIAEAAEMLGIPADEVDTLILKTTGKGMTNFENIPEVRKIVDKYRPGQAQTGKVKVEFEGLEGDYKYFTPAQLAAAKAKYGSKVKVVE